MRKSIVFFVPLAIAASSLAIFWACSSSDGNAVNPPVGPAPDASSIRDSSVADVRVPLGPQPTCTTTDIAVGTGAKFCDLPGTDTTAVTVPSEFCAREFTTTPVREARVLRFAPNGDLFVSAPSMGTAGGASQGPGSIVVLPDDNHDGVADSIVNYGGPFARTQDLCSDLETDPANLACVHGLLFADGYLYFTRSDDVRRVPYKSGDRALPTAPSELVANLGGNARPEMRWTHTLERKADGSLFVSRGRFDATACTADEGAKGAVLTLHVENGAAVPVTPETMADGFRNPMYVRCAPNSCGDCYANELTEDGWNGIGAREKVALLDQKGATWGFPCCVGINQPSPMAPSGYDCSKAAQERVAIPLHDTPFGLDFERGSFPEAYRHGIFVAVHGAITSFGGSGIVFLKTDPTSLRPTGEAAAFAKGFLPNGRATDVAFAPDGRLFVADDTTGRIYWIAPRTLAAPK